MRFQAHTSPGFFEANPSKIEYLSMRHFTQSQFFDASSLEKAFTLCEKGKFGLPRSLCACDFLSLHEPDGMVRWFMIWEGFPEFEMVKNSKESYLVPIHKDIKELEIPVGLLC